MWPGKPLGNIGNIGNIIIFWPATLSHRIFVMWLFCHVRWSCELWELCLESINRVLFSIPGIWPHFLTYPDICPYWDMGGKPLKMRPYVFYDIPGCGSADIPHFFHIRKNLYKFVPCCAGCISLFLPPNLNGFTSFINESCRECQGVPKRPLKHMFWPPGYVLIHISLAAFSAGWHPSFQHCSWGPTGGSCCSLGSY